VGDSSSDFCVSHEADYVLAKYRLIGHCERHGIAHAPFQGFSDATPWLLQFMQQQEALA
jgi:2-hydroxy-3-keto-5-methylthiopentenyl-1-phosphate phosphatase